jgi:hypothetical protein
LGWREVMMNVGMGAYAHDGVGRMCSVELAASSGSKCNWEVGEFDAAAWAESNCPC